MNQLVDLWVDPVEVHNYLSGFSVPRKNQGALHLFACPDRTPVDNDGLGDRRLSLLRAVVVRSTPYQDESIPEPRDQITVSPTLPHTVSSRVPALPFIHPLLLYQPTH